MVAVENKKTLIPVIAGGLVLLLIVGLVGVYFLNKNRTKSESNDNTNLNPIPTPEPKYLSYVDPSGKFSLQYPNGWAQEKPDSAINIMFKSPKESESDAYLENVNVGIEESTDPNYTVDNYNEYAKYSLNQTLENFKLVKEDKLQVDGVSAIELIFTTTSSGKNARTLQRYVIKDKFVYVLSYTGYEESYGKFEKEGLESIGSFKFL